jgi:hypothetical protein
LNMVKPQLGRSAHDLPSGILPTQRKARAPDDVPGTDSGRR